MEKIGPYTDAPDNKEEKDLKKKEEEKDETPEKRGVKEYYGYSDNVE